MPDERPSIPPPSDFPPHDEEHRSGRKTLVERLIKRGLDTGIGAISKSEDTVRGFVEGLKIPKEMASLALEQIDETKNGLYRAVAKEIRDFLNSTNFASEMKKVLTGLAFEVKMEVRFKNTDDNSIRPDVTADVSVKERERKRKRGE